MKQLFTKAKLKKIETLCKKLIILLGDDPDRPGMIKTPERYAKACAEWFEGMQYTNEEIAEKFNITQVPTILVLEWEKATAFEYSPNMVKDFCDYIYSEAENGFYFTDYKTR